MIYCISFYNFLQKICKKPVTRIMNKSKKVVPATTKTLSTSEPTRSTMKSFENLPLPIKSDSDKKDYKVIQLSNGLIACLISDTSLAPVSEYEESECEDSDEDSSSLGSSEGSQSAGGSSDTMEYFEDEEHPKGSKHHDQKMAAAGLCIGVGSFSDPKEVPGMAHFLEHMVFMGSEKYPKENAFDEFIKLHGGSDNASTDTETTMFYFECLGKHFEEALDRFSQFFINPLMKRDSMTREREAIESEFKMSLSSDSSRNEQLLCSLAKNESPVNSFPWGNLITLQDNIADEVLYKGVHEFRKRHYSAHRMTLAVQTQLPLETLEQYVLKTFSSVPNNGLMPDDFSKFSQSVFDTPAFNKMYHIIPIKDVCQLDMTWALPSLKDKYQTKPHHVLSYLLGDEGKGSLLSYLKRKLWVIGTTIGSGESGIEHNSLYTLFTVNLNLTEEGYNNLNEVIQVIFSYLKMIKEEGIDVRIFNEIQSIAYMGFKYTHEEEPIDNVENICEAMQFYPPEHYLCGSELYFEFEPKTIDALIDCMTPEKVNIMVMKQQIDKKENLQTEKWFGTQYYPEDIPKSWLEQWKNAPINAELAMPPPNSFITNDFSILPDLKTNVEYPQKILDNSLIELWYKKDMKFKLPLADYCLYLISPLSLRDVKHSCMLDMLVNLLTIDIGEESYPATSANLSYSFSAYEKGLIIKVWGFNQKLPILLDLIKKYLINLSDRITEDMFGAIKDKLLKSYYNRLLKPSGLAKDLRINLLVNNNWLPTDRYLALSNITFTDMKQYIQDFFRSLYIKALVQGNITDSTAINTINDFIEKLHYVPLKKEDIPIYQVVRVNKGEKCCRIHNFNSDDSNSIITNYYQSDHYTVENSMIVELILMIIEEPLFDILRTKEQLGYHVACSIKDTFGVLGYTITVNAQATKTTVKFVDERIEAFLKHTRTILANLDAESYDKIKKNLIKIKQCSDVHLKEEVDRNWAEITSGDYIFDRKKKEIEAIENTDLKTLCSWWDKHNSFEGCESFRKLSIQVEGLKEAPKDTPKLEIVYKNEEVEANAKGNPNYFINNIGEYKSTLETLKLK